MAHTDEYLDCVNNWWSGFVGKETCEAGYLVCKGEECDRYTPEKKQKKQTNADKYFRNATDEEIAEWLNLLLWGANTDVPYASFCTVEKWLDWLKQEVESDG